MKIAVIGGGISGLTAAHYLGPNHDVTLFEKNNYIGGHTNTVTVEEPDGPLNIDTGFIVFNDRTYPNFQKLLGELAIDGKPTVMSFGIRCLDTGLEYSGTGLNGFYAQRRNLLSRQHHRLLRDIIRFNRLASSLAEDELAGLTVNDFFHQHCFTDRFLWKYFMPMGASIWSCSFKSFLQFPIRFIIAFYQHHGLLTLRDRPQWMVVENGSRRYVEAILSRNRFAVRPNAKVTSISRQGGQVTVSTVDEIADSYDHVILACHADQSLALLGNSSTPLEQAVLPYFRYQENVALLHTDTTILPTNRRAWACWNYLASQEDQQHAVLTYNMNLLQGILSKQTYCVSLNAEQLVNKEMILRRIVYQHPLFTTDRDRLQALHPKMIDHQRVSYCGAYWGNGFHEDGVNSALAIVERLGGQSGSKS